MASDLTIRAARRADAGSIAAVHRSSRAAYYGSEPDPEDGREEMWSALLAQHGRSTYVAETPGLVGFISLIRPEAGDPALELTALYVDPEHFGRGVGSLLYGRFVDELRPAEPGVLEVWAGNQRAVGFYERRGWAPTAVERPGPQDLAFVTYSIGP